MRLVFRGNRAAIGPVIYASDVDVCEWYDARSPFFEDIQESWTFMEMSNNYLLRGTSELDLPDYYIQTVAHSIWLPEDKGIVSAVLQLMQHFLPASGIILLSISCL